MPNQDPSPDPAHEQRMCSQCAGEHTHKHDYRDYTADDVFTHICEVCGKTRMLTSQQAYWGGWDYPPQMGDWGKISPRTCEDCGIDDTVWWALAMDHLTADDLSPTQLQTVARIRNEIPD